MKKIDMQLFDAYGYMKRRINVLAKNIDCGGAALSHKEAVLVWILSRENTSSVKDLAEATMTDPAAASRCLSQLRNKKIVKNVASSKDKRVQNFTLTAKGITESEQINKVVEELSVSVFKNLNSKEKAALLELLTKVCEA